MKISIQCFIKISINQNRIMKSRLIVFFWRFVYQIHWVFLFWRISQFKSFHEIWDTVAYFFFILAIILFLGCFNQLDIPKYLKLEKNTNLTFSFFFLIITLTVYYINFVKHTRSYCYHWHPCIFLFAGTLLDKDGTYLLKYEFQTQSQDMGKQLKTDQMPNTWHKTDMNTFIYHCICHCK